jgi:hypothetical protein
MASKSPQMVLFRSGFTRDEDGAPHAYHVGHDDGSPDPGLDHICVGGDVLEFVDGVLHNRYSQGGSVGSLKGHSPQCKRDYLAIKAKGFPKCGPGELCMRWYGVAAEKRSCGYPNYRNDDGCGVPIKQVGADGKETGFYLTKNTLRRPGSNDASRVQDDYADATKVPFIVISGGLKFPMTGPWQPGDLAVVVWRGRVAYAVVGDTGPRTKLGEGSRALLADLGVSGIEKDDPATTLLFPGSAGWKGNQWPLTKEMIAEAVKKKIAESGGVAALSACKGLDALK